MKRSLRLAYFRRSSVSLVALGVAAGLAAAGCGTRPDSNVAELAAQVALDANPANAAGCRPIGPVEAHAVTIGGARSKLRREALFRGADLVVVTQQGHGTTPWGRPQTAPGLPTDTGSLVQGIGYACPGRALLPALRGVTVVPSGKVLVEEAAPHGCERVGTPIEALSGGQAGAAEDGLRNGAALFSANYVEIVDHQVASGLPGLKGRPFSCPVGP
jgi:hypothetical protein